MSSSEFDDYQTLLEALQSLKRSLLELERRLDADEKPDLELVRSIGIIGGQSQNWRQVLRATGLDAWPLEPERTLLSAA